MRSTLERAGADPARIVLELSEGQLVARLGGGKGFVRSAHELGCRIALDGYVQGGRGSALLRGFPSTS